MQVMNVLYIGKTLSAAETDFHVTLISGRFIRISYKISCGQLIHLRYFSSPDDLACWFSSLAILSFLLHCFYCINSVVRTVI